MPATNALIASMQNAAADPKAARAAHLAGSNWAGAFAASIESSADKGQKLSAMKEFGLKYGKQALGILGEINKAQTYQQEADNMKQEGLSFEDMSLYNKVKRMDPRRVQAVLNKFRDKIVPLFVGPNGLLEEIKKLAAAIKPEDEADIGKVSLMAGIADKIQGFSKAIMLVATHASKIKVEDLEKAKPNIQKAFASLGSLVKTISSDQQLLGLDTSNLDKLPTTDYFDRITSSFVSIYKLNSKIKSYTDQKVSFMDSTIEPEKIPLVIGIQRMVSVANAVNKELAGLSDIAPIDVKLQALAEGLGLKGGKFQILDGKKVNVEITMNVSLDSKELSKELVTTKQYVAGGTNAGKL